MKLERVRAERPDCGRVSTDRYIVIYFWDDGELVGSKMIENLTRKDAHRLMKDLGKDYPHFIKGATMAKVEEMII